ncbi:MAG: bacteriohemerythrin [Syntrophales bacterium LBB04]|nr:bacteriohemerythrin [Syntrophales bacterium LBB04]
MIKSIGWDESLSLGIKEIDDEHKNLIGYYNNFFAACFSSVGQAVINATLLELVDYTKHHFQHEEVLMEKESYPGLAEQKNEHESLLRTTLELQEKLMSGSSDNVSTETLTFMNNWILTHLMEVDAAFAKFVHAPR